MAQPTITNATPGNMVVPLSAIIDQLKQKLSNSEIDILLQAIVSKKKSEVRPGDLITSELINQILHDLTDLQVRVTELEAGAGSAQGHVVIFRPLPGEQFKAEQDMTIEGKNLGVSDGSSIIKINDVTVTTYRPGASDEKVTVNIPAIQVGIGGQSVLLTVANGKSSAERQIYLLPAHDLSGHVDLSWIDAEPLIPTTGAAITFKFRAKSRANLDATYLITPIVSRVPNASDWNTQLEVLDKDKIAISSKQISVIAGGETLFHVRLKNIPMISGNTTPNFVLSVAASAGQVKDGTGPLVMKVGTSVELPDPDVSLAYDSDQFLPTSNDGSFTRDSEEDTVTVKANAAGVITMAAEIKRTGTYRVLVEKVSGAGNWTVRPHPQDPASYPITDQDLNNADKKARVLPRFQFLPGASPDAAGEVRLKIARDGTSISRSVLVLVKKG